MPGPGTYRLYNIIFGCKNSIGFVDLHTLNSCNAYFKLVGRVRPFQLFSPTVLIRMDDIHEDEGCCDMLMNSSRFACEYTVDSKIYNRRCLRIVLPENADPVLKRIRIVSYNDSVAVGVKISLSPAYVWARVSGEAVEQNYLAPYLTAFERDAGHPYLYFGPGPDL
ncbi:hypothetical protein ACWJJH_00260 [Endozoicomonadaceae bacterium StTr2]